MANEKLSALVVEATIEQITDEQITETWMRAVRNDARIDSDAALTHFELRDHVPAIIE